MTERRVFAITVAFSAFLIMFGASAYAADCNNGGRYEVMDDGTVTDCSTGLIWLQDANCTDSLGLPGIDKSAGTLDWYDAMKWVAALGDGHCGLTDDSYAGDWRLPSKTEWMSMIAYAKKMEYLDPVLTNTAGTAQWTTNGDAFNNVVTDSYWSSTASGPAAAWFVHMYAGFVGSGLTYEGVFHYVWPVRAGQSGTFSDLIIQ